MSFTYAKYNEGAQIYHPLYLSVINSIISDIVIIFFRAQKLKLRTTNKPDKEIPNKRKKNIITSKTSKHNISLRPKCLISGCNQRKENNKQLNNIKQFNKNNKYRRNYR